MRVGSVSWLLALATLLVCAELAAARWGSGGAAGVAKKRRAERDAGMLEELAEQYPELDAHDLHEKLVEVRRKRDYDESLQKMKARRERELVDKDDPWRSGYYVKLMAMGCGGCLVAMMVYVGQRAQFSTGPVAAKKRD